MFHTFSGYIEISERTEDSSIWLRVRFCHKLFPHVLTHGIIFGVNNYRYFVYYSATGGLANKI